MIRNVGNLIAPADSNGLSQCDASGAAAIEFALANLAVTDIIICGHSECGAMHALLNGRHAEEPFHLRSWLRHGEAALESLEKNAGPDPTLARHNQLSQLNVLSQIDHLRTHPCVRQRVQAGRLRLHAWWFELKSADVYAYDSSLGRFVLIDDTHAGRLLKRLE